ncbi:hypothetical protein SHM7688_00197 [Shimia marina]|uniref:Uncharacterized protein n=1 Tax=Shimia marina TaxID=321267 RepID=A0A0P1EKQ5_9RHOB|nr:hypothetical protein SHM7688_00197 [Shimia marina]
MRIDGHCETANTQSCLSLMEQDIHTATNASPAH